MMTATPLDAFRQAIEQAGLMAPDEILPDGQLHRFASNGDRADDAGWYVLYGDGLPAGSFGDWRSGFKQNWCAKADRQMSATEREEHHARVERARQQREAAEQIRHLDAAQRAQTIWNEAAPATGQHPYLQKKQILPHGLRLDADNRLIVPVMIGGEITSLQFIDEDGGKKFLTGGAITAGSVTLGELSEALPIVLCEGVATGASLYEATGYPTICAFSAGNLLPVAHAVREHHPSAVIVLAGDNDIRSDETPNTGLEAATAAAHATGGVLLMPELDGRKCDWNDVHTQRGLDAVQAAITTAIRREETATMQKTPPTSAEAEVTRLATLSNLEYGLTRKDAAKRLGLAVSFLDTAVFAERKKRETTDDGRGHALEFEDLIPAFEPVDGAALGNRLAALFARFAALPEHGATTLTLWTLFTYCLDRFQIAPRLDLSSPEKQCGKTTVLSLLSRLVFRAALSSNISHAAIFRVIARHKPTLLIDEMDSFIEANEELRGILNSGHTREAASIIRCEGDDHEPKMFSTWAAMAFAHIGSIPDTLEDRSIRLPMRRKLPSERVESLRQTGPAAEVLLQELSTVRRHIARWVEDASAAITSANPSPVGGLSDRAVDNWMPLLSIADALGGTWPAQARKAAAELSGQSMTDNESIRVELLTDIRSLFDGTHVPNGRPVDRLSSADLCNFLALMEERPWGTWKHGKPMTPVQLARALKPFRVSSRTVRVEGEGTARGYLSKDFADAFTRYIPSPTQDSAISKCNSDTTRSQSDDNPLFQGDTEMACVTSENGLNPAPRAECVSVSLQKPEFPAGGMFFEEEGGPDAR